MAKAKRPAKEKNITKAPMEEIPTSLEELAKLGAEDSPAKIEETVPAAESTPLEDPPAKEVRSEEPLPTNEKAVDPVVEKTTAPAPEPMTADNSEAALAATLELVASKKSGKNEDNGEALPEFVFPSADSGDPLVNLGPALKARRESLGLSFAEITRRTCMAQSTILALESQPLDKLDAAFYIKNRLGLYASVLEIDPKKIQEFFCSCIAAKEEKTQTLNHSSSLKRWLLIGFIILILAAVAVVITLK